MIWNTSKPVRPDNLLYYSAAEVKELIILARLSRYNRGIACGSKYIRQELESLNIRPLPSEYRIKQVLKENGLTYYRTGNY